MLELHPRGPLNYLAPGLLDTKRVYYMTLNQVDIHFLIAAICVITSSLVFYTIGVWGERLQKKLRAWHLVFFVAGLFSDAVGTGLMEHIAQLTHIQDNLHTITGLIALVLMFVHALWAIWTYFRGTEKAKRNFNRFSLIVWFIWLIPYGLGIYLGMSLGR